ncbi:MAG TPA: hypothetical protein VLL75_03610 [Vicinamibacteria bacterium]|nr:hypothetical protein [Vicinamibacteria bacterium]
MRADAAEADRRHEVREAARGWQRAGAIDDTTLAKVEAAYADDRNRLGPIFRVLVFVFTLVVLQGGLGLVGLLAGHAGETALAFVFLLGGLGLAILTDVQIGPWRRRQGGTEPATASLAVVLVIGTATWLFADVAKPPDRIVVDAALLLAAAVLGAAGHRWGYALFTAFSAVAAFFLLGRFPYGRLLWVIAALVLAPLALRASDSPDLAPSHRRSWQAVALVALVFLYVALHLSSWDLGLVEMLTGRWPGTPGAPRPARPFFIATTALVPVLTLAWGLRSRRRLLINLALVGLLASLVTLRFYVHVAPLWVVLVAGGGAAILLALLLRRYLESGAGRERGGFTAEPVFTDAEGRSTLEVAASIASYAPAPRPVAEPGFEAGGGRSGGAGASGNF